MYCTDSCDWLDACTGKQPDGTVDYPGVFCHEILPVRNFGRFRKQSDVVYPSITTDRALKVEFYSAI